MEKKMDDLLEEVKKRYAKLPNGVHVKEEFIKQLKTLSQYYDEPWDYPEFGNVNFPESIHIGYAVCHPECGVKQFIVDGSTHKCDRCGGSMFQSESKEYFLKKD